MNDIRIGDVFRDYGPPRRVWRVAAERDGTFELICVEKPSVSRFAQSDRLLEPYRYVREPRCDGAGNVAD